MFRLMIPIITVFMLSTAYAQKPPRDQGSPFDRYFEEVNRLQEQAETIRQDLENEESQLDLREYPILPGVAEPQRPQFLRLIQFNNYVFHAPTGESTFRHDDQDDSSTYAAIYRWWIERTRFLGLNGSASDAKVRVQGLLSNGTIAWEYDLGIAPGNTAQLLRFDLNRDTTPRVDAFIIASNKPIFVTAHTIQSLRKTAFAFNVDIATGSTSSDGASVRESQTHIPVSNVDCATAVGLEWVCAAPTSLSTWETWLPTP